GDVDDRLAETEVRRIYAQLSGVCILPPVVAEIAAADAETEQRQQRQISDLDEAPSKRWMRDLVRLFGQPKAAQAQGIGDDADARQRHRSSCESRAQEFANERIEGAGRDRDQEH